MIAFLFPGQGSQRRGVGQGLFDEVREYGWIEKDVDSIVGYSLRELCLEDVENRLRETQFTQPCLYVVNALYYYKALRQGMRPAYVEGHSLGEYNALLAGGVFDFLTGLRLVKKRGELMSQARNGGMGAIVGLSPEMIAKILEDNGLTEVDIANYNGPGQTVISGSVNDINRAAPIFEKAGAHLYMPLPVSAAFHSRYMADAAQAFAEFLAPMTFSAPRTPVISNVTAQPYPTANASEGVKTLLTKQIDHPVQWTQCVRFLFGQGVTQFNEIGPGNVLTQTITKIQPEFQPQPLAAATSD